MSGSQLTLPEAHSLLRQFDCLTHLPVLTPDARQQLQTALLGVVKASDYQTLGICATTPEQGFQALRGYLAALGYAVEVDPDTVKMLQEGVCAGTFIKFNTQTGSCYLDAYPGQYRGVLVTCQSAYENPYAGTYGHFPLDLFDDPLKLA